MENVNSAVASPRWLASRFVLLLLCVVVVLPAFAADPPIPAGSVRIH